MYVFLTPPPLSGLYQVHEGAIGCLEQTNNLGNLSAGTLIWSPQGHHFIKHFIQYTGISSSSIIHNLFKVSAI